MATREDVELRQRAERALRGGHAQEALVHYTALLENVEIYDARRYDGWLEGALQAYEALGRTREAGVVLLALRRFGEAQRHFSVAERPLEWALAASRLGRHGEAARVLSQAGHPVLAAVELETAGTHAAARLEWERVLGDARLAGFAYETALAHFSLGQSLLRTNDRAAAERELTTTQRLLEVVADDFETRGDTARALDCYLLLLRLGRDTGSFENTAEGYLNSIRILAADDRKHYALQFYEDFLAYAVEQKEWYAAATLAREASDYSVKVGLVFDRHYLERAAQLWEATSTSNEAAGGPVDLSENALHAAIDAAAQLGDHALVARLYGAVAALPLSAKKRARYARLAARGAGVLAAPAPPAPAFPEYLRRTQAYQDVSRADLVEWALDGDPAAVPARWAMGIDRGAVELPPAERKAERLAMRAVLLASAPTFSLDDPAGVASLARALGRTEVYEMLRPLERLADHAAPTVRVAVMEGARRIFQARTVNLLRKGLADPVPAVARAALASLGEMGYKHGFNPLARIFRETTDDGVRAVVVEAIGNVGTLEAGLFLLDLVRHDVGALRTLAAARLAAFPGEEVTTAVRQALEVETGERRVVLEGVLAKLVGPGR